jgi:hypothetical protein
MQQWQLRRGVGHQQNWQGDSPDVRGALRRAVGVPADVCCVRRYPPRPPNPLCSGRGPEATTIPTPELTLAGEP